jgi:hypothetical protein
MHFQSIVALVFAATAHASFNNTRGSQPGDIETSEYVTIEARSTIQKRECYRSGEPWGNDKEFALAAIVDACNEPGMAERHYRQGEWFLVCKGLPGNRRIEYKIHATGTSRWVNREECKEFLKFEVTGCPNGGGREHSGVLFR